jgi:hypothetical protein
MDELAHPPGVPGYTAHVLVNQVADRMKECENLDTSLAPSNLSSLQVQEGHHGGWNSANFVAFRHRVDKKTQLEPFHFSLLSCP